MAALEWLRGAECRAGRSAPSLTPAGLGAMALQILAWLCLMKSLAVFWCSSKGSLLLLVMPVFSGHARCTVTSDGHRDADSEAQVCLSFGLSSARMRCCLADNGMQTHRDSLMAAGQQQPVPQWHCCTADQSKYVDMWDWSDGIWSGTALTALARAPEVWGSAGHMDADTREWSDGILTAAARAVAKEPLQQRSWIICDGDVDPEWIESSILCWMTTGVAQLMTPHWLSCAPILASTVAAVLPTLH